MRWEGTLVIAGLVLAVGVWAWATYSRLRALRGRVRSARSWPAAADLQYAEAVRDYNDARESFPSSLLAIALGFGPEAP
jgi:hypothetical protein